MSEAAFEALRAAEAAQEAGDPEGARRWFDRAHRLSPDNPRVALPFGAFCLSQGDLAGATRFFESVLEAVDVRQAWLGLAVAQHLLGDHIKSGEIFSRILGGYAHDASSDDIADLVAHSQRVAGWCALTGDGELKVRWTAWPGSRTVTCVLDGKTIPSYVGPDSPDFVCKLPRGWESGRTLQVWVGGGPALNGDMLLGSPIDIQKIVRVEGFVDSTDGKLEGWAWCPNDPDRDPMLFVKSNKTTKHIKIIARRRNHDIPHKHPLAQLRSFNIPYARLTGMGQPIRLMGRGGRALIGSPTNRAIVRTRTTLPDHSARPNKVPELPRPVDVVIPVYDGFDLAMACIRGVLDDLPSWARVIVVDDFSSDPRVQSKFRELADDGLLMLLTQPFNAGFLAAANVGLCYSPTRDVVLLNSDTLVPPGWLARLRAAAYSAPDIGTATPLSNDGTIMSYPSVTRSNPVPDQLETNSLDALAQKANSQVIVDVPTAVGFCMYVRRDCLDTTGLFREEIFAQGYGEENDFCMRSRSAGWRHVGVPSVFVGHVGGHSFGPAKWYLIERNSKRLDRLHPGYEALVRAFELADPLSSARRRLDTQRWTAARETIDPASRQSVILVTHGLPGGVQKFVKDQAAAARAEGLRPIVLRPVTMTDGGRGCEIWDPGLGETPNLRFSIPSQLNTLVTILEGDCPLRGEVHHLRGHDHTILKIFDRLRIPFDIIVHDYSWFCPRNHLIGVLGTYCGEPDVSECETCVDIAGTMNNEDTRPRILRKRSAKELAVAACIVAPSKDVATRLRHHFPNISPMVHPWEDDSVLPRRQIVDASDGRRTVCVIGGIGTEKGYDVLLACARDAGERQLPLVFRVVGYTQDDDPLLATGSVSITGPYVETEALALIQAQNAQLAWLPSVCPETWSYTTTLAWQAGLDLLAFDVGSPSERIRATGRGWLLPLAMAAAPEKINDFLMSIELPPVDSFEPAPAAFMTTAMWFAWLLRTDVRQSAAIGDVEVQRQFVFWWQTHGRSEYPDAPGPCVSKLMPKPALLRRHMPDGVNLVGFARAESGLGEDVRTLSKVLDAVGIPHAVLDVAPEAPTRLGDLSIVDRFADELRYPVSIICTSPLDTAFLYLKRGSSLFAAPRTVGYWPWELPRLPSVWNKLYALVDEVWAPSRFSARAFASCNKPVMAMPPVVLQPSVHPMSRERAGLPDDGFVFVYPFDPNSYIARKNPVALVKAFRAAFPLCDRSVVLLLRVNGHPGSLPGWQELVDEMSGDNRIVVRDGTLDRDEALSLLASCDALVSPHRSEGFGRNIAEAIMLGLPVLATGFSGCVDFLRPEEMLTWTPRLVGPGEYPFGEGQTWAEVDQVDLIEKLKILRAFPRSNGRNRALEFAETHSVAKVGARLSHRIQILIEEAHGYMRYRTGMLQLEEVR